MRVRFHDPGEFLTELRQSPPNVEPVLRLTVRRRVDPGTGVINHLTVVATYLRQLPQGGQPLPLVVLLEAYQGEDWGAGFEDSQQTRDRTQSLLARLRAVAGELSLECRPGVYEPPSSSERK